MGDISVSWKNSIIRFHKLSKTWNWVLKCSYHFWDLLGGLVVVLGKFQRMISQISAFTGPYVRLEQPLGVCKPLEQPIAAGYFSSSVVNKAVIIFFYCSRKMVIYPQSAWKGYFLWFPKCIKLIITAHDFGDNFSLQETVHGYPEMMQHITMATLPL